METNKTITIEALDREGVIIHAKVSIVYNGQAVVVGEEKTHYPNSVTGRSKFREVMQEEDINVYKAVMFIWGDEPTIDETASEMIEEV